jgi:phosphoribosylamine--glycine ligase
MGDTGPNTGGMGAVSPVPLAKEAFMLKIKEKIVEPTIAGLQKENLAYIGIVFIGIIKVGEEPYVIEYNCRLGDPETEVVLPRIKNDLVEVFSAAATGLLKEITIETIPQTAVTVVAVSGGYPNVYESGKAITGLQEASLPGTVIFHAGTRQQGDAVLTNGGRVLAVTSFGDNITEASEQSIYQLEHIFFDEIYYRSDIGFEFA